MGCASNRKLGRDACQALSLLFCLLKECLWEYTVLYMLAVSQEDKKVQVARG